MSIRLNATTPYGRGSSPIQTDRGVEFDVLASVTRQLKVGTLGTHLEFPVLCAAIHSNRQLWTTLAADVADPENALPKELKSKIFYLSEFINKHSRAVLRKTESTEALIDINLAVMRGLSSAGSV